MANINKIWLVFEDNKEKAKILDIYLLNHQKKCTINMNVYSNFILTLIYACFFLFSCDSLTLIVKK